MVPSLHNFHHTLFPTHQHYSTSCSSFLVFFHEPREDNALPSGAIMELLHEGSEHGRRPNGEGGEAGLTECSGNLQHQQLLHVPCNEEALLWHGGEPNGA